MPHKLNGEYTIHGHVLTVEVSPCCWMYQYYPFQVSYTAKDGRSHGVVADRQWKEATATSADVQTMLERHLHAELCEKCATPHLRNDTDAPKCDGSRLRFCEVCFLAKIKAEYEEEQKKEDAKIARRDKRKKAQGFTHKVLAVVHPAGGDDRVYDIYTKGRPSDAQMRDELRRLGSVVLDSYTITEL